MHEFKRDSSEQETVELHNDFKWKILNVSLQLIYIVSEDCVKVKIWSHFYSSSSVRRDNANSGKCNPIKSHLNKWLPI